LGDADTSLVVVPKERALITPVRRLLVAVSAACALGATTALAMFAPVAQAEVVTLSTCNSNALTQPFAPWADPSSYELAPGGDFESSTWSLSDGAQVVSGSESYAATGTLGSSSLSLPAGASAQSPSTCVNAAYPTIRFFVAGTGTVLVQVVYGGNVISSGVATATGGWMPTAVMLTGSAIAGAANGGTAQVSLQLTALSGNPQVDDVFIDPWHRG
jgi:hypothetical protein